MSTLKQKRAAELVESGRTMGEVMVEAGYSKNTAIAPTKLTNSKGWEELMEKHLPDDLILKSLREDIKLKPQNRVAELGLASKLKGKLTDKTELSGLIQLQQVTGMKIIKDK